MLAHNSACHRYPCGRSSESLPIWLCAGSVDRGCVRKGVQLLVDGLSTKSNLSARSFECVSTYRVSICPARPRGACPTCWSRDSASEGRGGAGFQQAGRPCSYWHICGADTPTPSSPAGFGVGTTRAYRYVAEAVEILAARAWDLAAAVRTAACKVFVILDGTLPPVDRIAADRSSTRSLNPGTSEPTANGGVARAAGPPASTQRSIGAAMRSSAPFHRLKTFRAVATRYDKRAYVFHRTVTVAAIRRWLRA